MAYARIEDIQARMSRTLTDAEKTAAETLLEDAGGIIDAFGLEASISIKKIVSCRMVIRALGDGTQTGVPIGATQGSMSGLGYSQSWTIGAGAVGELYLSKIEKNMLGMGDRIGSRSPVEDLT